MYGKSIRLNRLFDRQSKKLFSVPIDHGVTLGPIEGITNPLRVLRELNEGGCDAVVLHKGVLKLASRHSNLCAMKYILHLSASTNHRTDAYGKALVSSVDEAVGLGADAVSVHVNIGSEHEGHMLKDLGAVSARCVQCGLPLLAMMYCCHRPRNHVELAHPARVAEELGADIVKVALPEVVSDVGYIVDTVTIPVVVAGGEKASSIENLLYHVQEAMQSGAAGAAIGRNVFQSGNVSLVTRVLGELIHGRADMTDCISLLRQAEAADGIERKVRGEVSAGRPPR